MMPKWLRRWFNRWPRDLPTAGSVDHRPEAIRDDGGPWPVGSDPPVESDPVRHPRMKGTIHNRS